MEMIILIVQIRFHVFNGIYFATSFKILNDLRIDPLISLEMKTVRPPIENYMWFLPTIDPLHSTSTRNCF